MPIVEWSGDYLLGIKVFDEHHKHLVGLLNRAYDEYSRNPTAGDLEDIIKELVDYATYHFDAEENWMRENSYPHLAAHKKEHETFSQKVSAFQKEFQAGQATSSSVFLFLAEWLTDHILETDTEYKRFMTSKNSA